MTDRSRYVSTRAPLHSAIRWVLAASTLALLAGAAVGPSRPLATPRDAPAYTGADCPAQPAAPPARVISGDTLDYPNFSGQDLRNADFSGKTLVSPVFFRADLRGAKFVGTVFQSGQAPGGAPLPTEFALARLGAACFIGARFVGRTDFSHADLTSADFSSTDLSNTDLVVFGTRLRYTPADGGAVATRPAFRGTTMSCDFVPQWPQLDLTRAVLRGCGAQLKGADLSGAAMAGVDFSGLDLAGTRWTGAVLEGTDFQDATLDGATGLAGSQTVQARLSGALFNNASAVGVDFAYAQLYGADFTYADLTNTRFAGAFLTAGGPTNQSLAAKFVGARLRNATFASAKLQSVSFASANLYGVNLAGAPNKTCEIDVAKCTPQTPRTGYTCSCASLAGADLTLANFAGAFLWGVDFAQSTTIVNGTNFDAAILVGANFDGVSFRVASGAPASFRGAMLQGANLGADATGALGMTLTGAYLDFESNGGGGNGVNVLLGSDHTRFRNWRGPSRVCIDAGYNRPSVVPTQATLDCPDGLKSVCGASPPRPNPNSRWASGTPLAAATPVPGWYDVQATYDAAADPTLICGGAAPTNGW